jgi:hypothetical protein
MVMPVLSLAVPIPSAITNKDGFRLTLETHRAYFRAGGNYDYHAVDQHLAYVYQYDLYGYLTAKSINPELHWLTMRLSDIESPTVFDNTVDYLLIPNSEAYKKIKGLYSTSLGKVGK